MKTMLIVPLALIASTVLAQTPEGPVRSGGYEFANRAAFVAQGRRCATHEPTALQRRREFVAGGLVRQRNAAALKGGKVVVPVVFHVLHDKETGKLDKAVLEEQVRILNNCFGSEGFQFALKSVDYTDNADWFSMGWQSQAEYDAKQALSTKQPTKELNFYTANPGGGLLGWATFPSDLSGGDPTTTFMDGVVCLYTSLKGVSDNGPYNLGITGTHEVGHWLSLYHTFQGGCTDPGDEVEDTPAEATPAYGCPEKDDSKRDTCPAPGLDPTKNFMDYGDDACLHHFTEKQLARIREQVAAFRPPLLQAPPTAKLQPVKTDAKTLDAITNE